MAESNRQSQLAIDEHDSNSKSKKALMIGFDDGGPQFLSVAVDSAGRLEVVGTGGMGGTEFAEDSPHLSGALGTLGLVVRKDASGSLVDADGDYSPLQVTDSGFLRVSASVSNASLTVDDGGLTLSVDDGSGSLTVDGTVAVSNFPATQTVDDGGLTLSVDDGAGSLTVDGTVAVSNFPASQTVDDGGLTLSVDDGAGSLTVDGTVAVSNFPATQPVSGTVSVTQPVAVTDNSGSLTVDDGGLSLTVDGTVAVSNATFPTGAERSEDAASATGHTGLFILGVRRDTDGTQSAGTAGDYTEIQTDNAGFTRTASRPRKDNTSNLMNAVNITSTTPVNSSASTVTYRSWIDVFLIIDSTGTPTNLQIKPQASDDGGTTWYDYDWSYYPAIFFEDVEVSSIANKCIRIEALGNAVRFQAIPSGTVDGSNNWTLTIDVMPVTHQ